ncbi:TetR/AcrR family transcriptional regulator [Jiulongibacter sediminis]|uniref:TetR/AcrR family transcriptional regulator n=1 Tax=Jiulongibacter sediminis TaxID=1605367 RepID=UPI0026F1FE94|nr:TetR/AcrR family transcriptional regulator [Jiulongibacter sediminis]
MTEKQENILEAALRLFASEGYNATSTKKVAIEAGVSEGLIFRHFGNKEGLLQAILNLGKERFHKVYANIVLQSDPKEVIKKAILMLFEVPEEEYAFWKLQFKLKWELELVDHEKMAPLLLSLSNAFKELGYSNPEMEAKLLLHIHDGLATAILMGRNVDKEKMKDFLLEKYNV